MGRSEASTKLKIISNRGKKHKIFSVVLEKTQIIKVPLNTKYTIGRLSISSVFKTDNGKVNIYIHHDFYSLE